ncbi:hypothetical protein H1R20_g16669, partial [Candolleomyces eurysporus]
MLEGFAQLGSFQERLMLALGLTLNAIEISRRKSWSVTDELKAAIRYHTRAFLLSPMLTAYCGIDMGEQVMSVTRQLGVRNLPQEDDVNHVSDVLNLISSELCSFKNTMKEAIRASLVPNSSTANIANLTISLLRAIPPTQATVRHYIRFSFLRKCMKEHGDPSYWKSVDNNMEESRSRVSSASECWESFVQVYRDDILKYGEPTNTLNQVVEPSSCLAMRALSDDAMEVQRRSSKELRIQLGKRRRDSLVPAEQEWKPAVP